MYNRTIDNIFGQRRPAVFKRSANWNGKDILSRTVLQNAVIILCAIFSICLLTTNLGSFETLLSKKIKYYAIHINYLKDS